MNSIYSAEEGLRRSVCDMTLLIFHLVLSSFTFDGVDVFMAQNILEWNLKRYPEGQFFFSCQISHSYPLESRCILPLWCRPSELVSQPAPPCNRILHQGFDRTDTVPQSSPHIILGDCYCKSCTLGHPCLPCMLV